MHIIACGLSVSWKTNDFYLQKVQKFYRLMSSYLVDWAGPLIVVNMPIECNVHFIFLPELLKAIPSHGLFEGALCSIIRARWITEHTMSSKYQPWLFLPIYRGKAAFDKCILFRAFSPIMLSVRYAEVEHAIVCRIPEMNCKSHFDLFETFLK